MVEVDNKKIFYSVDILNKDFSKSKSIKNIKNQKFEVIFLTFNTNNILFNLNCNIKLITISFPANIKIFQDLNAII